MPFVVWISPRGGAKHDVRVRVSPGPKAQSSELISVGIRPDVHVIGDGELSTEDLQLLGRWVALNRGVLIRYWNGDIEYTEDANAELKPLD